jgi:hypothetical protein
MQKKCETNPITSFAINGLAFPAGRPQRALQAGSRYLGNEFLPG